MLHFNGIKNGSQAASGRERKKEDGGGINQELVPNGLRFQ